MGIFINIAANPTEEFDIKFEQSPDSTIEDMSELEKELYKSIEETTNTIKSLKHTKKETKEKYFGKLLSLARAGFLSDSPNPLLAQTSLEVLKKEMLLVEGARIKNRYMFLLGVGALASSLISWILYLLLSISFDLTAIQKYFVVWSGAMVGTWISFGARKFTIELDDLSILEKDNMSIFTRLPYIGFCSLIFLLFLESNIFSFQIGNISSEQIKNIIEFQLLIGIIAGLLESKLGVNLYEKVQNLTNS